MVIYGMSLFVFVEKIRREYHGFLHSWYADDFSTAGAGTNTKPTIARIEALGPQIIYQTL